MCFLHQSSSLYKESMSVSIVQNATNFMIVFFSPASAVERLKVPTLDAVRLEPEARCPAVCAESQRRHIPCQTDSRARAFANYSECGFI